MGHPDLLLRLSLCERVLRRSRFARYPCPQPQGRGAPASPMSPTTGTWGTPAKFGGGAMLRCIGASVAGMALLVCGVGEAFPQTPSVKVGVGTVSGTVYCTDTNLPARKAQVEVDPWPSASSDHPEGTVRSGFTDLDGRFSLNNVPAGEYAISVGLAGYLQFGPNLLDSPVVKNSREARKEAMSRLTKVVVVPGQTTTIALQAERGTEIVGSVQYDDGSPAIGLTFTFGPKGGDADRTNPAVSLWG